MMHVHGFRYLHLIGAAFASPYDSFIHCTSPGYPGALGVSIMKGTIRFLAGRFTLLAFSPLLLALALLLPGCALPPPSPCLADCEVVWTECKAHVGEPDNFTGRECLEHYNSCKSQCSQPPPRLTVRKVLSPTGDPGRFNLLIDGTVRASGVGDGGSTGTLEVSAGTHKVSETAAPFTNLTNYTQAIGGDCAANGTVTVDVGQSKTCTITNVRKSRRACLADCEVVWTECKAHVGEPDNFTGRECLEHYNSCKSQCL